jgi:hypothetical protein
MSPFAPLSASPHVQQHYGRADVPAIAAAWLVAAAPRPAPSQVTQTELRIIDDRTAPV